MVDEIYKLKNQFIARINADLSARGIDRINVEETGELVDMVKDLAEAEESCWKASYYKAVTEAMVGASSARTQGTMPQKVYAPSVHDELIDKLGAEYKRMNPDEKMATKNRILTMMGSM